LQWVGLRLEVVILERQFANPLTGAAKIAFGPLALQSRSSAHPLLLAIQRTLPVPRIELLEGQQIPAVLDVPR